MIALLALAFPFIVTLCPFAHALVLDLLNVSSSDMAIPPSSDPTLGVDPNVHCTRDPTWLVPTFPDIRYYDHTCQNAMFKATQDLTTYELNAEYEFLTRGAINQTTNQQIQLPRKYVFCKYDDLTIKLGQREDVTPPRRSTDKRISPSNVQAPTSYMRCCNRYDQ